MIKIDSIKLSAKKNTDLSDFVLNKYNIRQQVSDFRILKKSVDARDKEDIKFIYSVSLSCDKKEEERLTKKYSNISFYKENDYLINKVKEENREKTVVVVGMGPAGLFASLALVNAGLNVIILERGKCVEDRIKDVEKYWNSGELDTESNVQFGEGGAGTFSDGKLNTGVSDKEGRKEFILKTFVKNGAKEDILYDSKPHIGTDVLRDVIVNIRKELLKENADIRFSTKFVSFEEKADKLEINAINTVTCKSEKIICDDCILATGHSSRDTFEYLSKVLKMEAKPFAMGFRVIHSQDFINRSQYGEDYLNIYENLESAPYKLTYQGKDRGVYTFCMCPGGYVVNASSEEKRICVNGMSDCKRDSGFANSAVIIQINKEDLDENDCLSGMKMQRDIEERTYITGNGCIPVSFFKSFCDDSSIKYDIEFKDENRLLLNGIKGKYINIDISEIFPDFMNSEFAEAMFSFDKTIKGYAKENPLILASESRSSSPVKILRDEEYESSIKNIYPCGEGAGYAGGIVSAAIDGLKVAEKIISKYI